jgi:hypothetical protein
LLTQDANPGPSKYEAEVLTTMPQHSVMISHKLVQLLHEIIPQLHTSELILYQLQLSDNYHYMLFPLCKPPADLSLHSTQTFDKVPNLFQNHKPMKMDSNFLDDKIWTGRI